MLYLRKLHRYLGVFFTPAILFFAFSGALQTFGLHESKQRGAPPPIAWIAAMASVHKDQHLPEPRKTAPRPEAAAEPAHAAPTISSPQAAATAPATQDKGKSTLPLKLFVLALAIGLCLSSLVGLTLAFKNPRTRKEAGVMLGLGTLLPLLLLLL